MNVKSLSKDQLNTLAINAATFASRYMEKKDVANTHYWLGKANAYAQVFLGQIPDDEWEGKVGLEP